MERQSPLAYKCVHLGLSLLKQHRYLNDNVVTFAYRVTGGSAINHIFFICQNYKSNSDENCDAQNWVGNGHVGIRIDQTDVLGIKQQSCHQIQKTIRHSQQTESQSPIISKGSCSDFLLKIELRTLLNVAASSGLNCWQQPGTLALLLSWNTNECCKLRLIATAFNH